MRGERVVARVGARQVQATEAHRGGSGHIFVVEGAHRCAGQVDRITGEGRAIAAGARASGNRRLQRCSAVDHRAGRGVVHLVRAAQATDGQRLGRDGG